MVPSLVADAIVRPSVLDLAARGHEPRALAPLDLARLIVGRRVRTIDAVALLVVAFGTGPAPAVPPPASHYSTSMLPSWSKTACPPKWMRA